MLSTPTLIATTQIEDNINIAMQELQTSKYHVHYTVDYLTCEEVEGELAGSSRMNYVKPKGSITGTRYSGIDGYFAECRIIEFDEVYTLDNISKIVTESNTGVGTKLTFGYSLNGVEWKNIGYTTTIYAGDREVNFIRGKDLHSTDEFRYLRVIANRAALDIFDVYINKAKIEASRKIGIEHEQTVDIDDSVSLPKIIEVKAQLEDKTTNTYKLSIEDFKCDANGIPFFFWKADEAMFIGANEDYTEVRCTIDEGISGRKIPVRVYIGDALGHIGRYIVWLSSN